MRSALPPRRGHRAVLLVGDAAYYGRFGFSAERTGALWLPGLADKSRLLGRELTAGALDGVRGTIRAPKRPARTPLVAAIGGLRPRPQAASLYRRAAFGCVTNIVDAVRYSARRLFRSSGSAGKTPYSGVADQWPTTPFMPASTARS